MEKRNSNEQYSLRIKREKLTIFLLKKPPATKHRPQYSVSYMEFFLIECSLIGIVKP